MITLFFILLFICCFLGLYRILVGPDSIDRFIAVFVLTLLIICFLGIFAVWHSDEFFIDLTIDVVILVFIGTLILSKFLGGKELDE